MANEVETKAKETETKDAAQVQREASAKANTKDSWAELIKLGVISLILGILGFCIGKGSGDGMQWMMAWMFIGFPWGWKIINQLMTGSFMTWLVIWTEKAWWIAYIVKFVLAFFIGSFAWPIKLIIAVYHVISAKNLEKKVVGGDK